MLESWFKDDDVRTVLQVNRYQNVLWFNGESFDQLLALMLLAAVVDSASVPNSKPAQIAREIGNHFAVVRTLRQAQTDSGYKVENLLAAARGDAPTLTAK